MLNKKYYMELDAEGCIRIIDIINDNAIYYVDLCDGTGYCLIVSDGEYFEYHCQNEKEFMDYVDMLS